MRNQFWIVLIPMMFAASSAWAAGGNQDAYFMDDVASMTGGSVIATVGGGGAIWYNPAGIIKQRGHAVNLTATVYSIKSYRIDNFLVTEFDNQDSQEAAEFTEYLSAPTVLTYVRDLGRDTSFGFTVTVQRFSDLELRTSASQRGELEGVEKEAEISIAATDITAVYYAGPAISWAVTDEFRLGFSLLGFYRGSRGTTQQQIALRDPGAESDDFFVSASTIGSTKSLGLRPIVGAQWNPTRNWDFGVTYRAPMMAIWQSIDNDESVAYFVQEANQGQASTEPSVTRGFEFDTLEPSRWLLGVAYTWNSGHRIEIGADASLPIESLAAQDLEFIANYRIGSIIPLSDSMRLGTGLFTDLSGVADNEFGTIDVDYYGFTVGLEMTTDYELADGDTISFISTFGGMGQVGIGDGEGILFDPEFDPTSGRVVTARALFLEGALNLGLKTRF